MTIAAMENVLSVALFIAAHSNLDFKNFSRCRRVYIFEGGVSAITITCNLTFTAYPNSKTMIIENWMKRRTFVAMRELDGAFYVTDVAENSTFIEEIK